MICSGRQPQHYHRQLAKKRGDVARVIHVMVALVHHNLENLPRAVEALLAKLMLKLTGEVIKIGEVKCSKLVGNPLLELLVRLVVALCLGSHRDKKKWTTVWGVSNDAKAESLDCCTGDERFLPLLASKYVVKFLFYYLVKVMTKWWSRFGRGDEVPGTPFLVVFVGVSIGSGA